MADAIMRKMQLRASADNKIRDFVFNWH